ncbi:hypothetical protein AALP_AA7G009200 [Arabis alpina]|uniref:Uncharacterized protein n=1 Tax=Arabis alpina TaxID=50452 RepID=A0A087GF83_ARAAL|nr:hypothetical protein AALP_AA7G009200 [Arabis alpina]
MTPHQIKYKDPFQVIEFYDNSPFQQRTACFRSMWSIAFMECKN